jgi:WD40 repeat protein
LANGRLVTTILDYGTEVPLRIWDTTTWQQPEPWRSANTGRVDQSIVNAESSRDGRLLATALVVGRVFLWDVASRRQLAQVEAAGLTGTCPPAFSPDGQRLAFCNRAGAIGLFDVSTLRVTGTFAARTPPSGLAFSPDGRRLASTPGGALAAVTLWDVATQGRLIDVTSEPNIYFSPQFSPDGRTLTVMCRGETFFWRVPTLAEIDESSEE